MTTLIKKVFAYKYRGTDPDHRDNVELRKALNKEIPLIYFHGIVSGKYLAVWPVYIIADEPSNLTFTVAVDDSETIYKEPGQSVEDSLPDVPTLLLQSERDSIKGVLEKEF